MGTADPRRVLLIGDPVAHSLSPAMHNAAFQALRIDAVYEARRVSQAELPAVVAALRGDAYLGANVTLPHKEAVLGLVDELAALVDSVGAANTLVRVPRGLRAENTDVHGFRAALAEAGVATAGRRVLLLGAGGAARAIVAALEAASVAICARRPAQAEDLVRAIGSRAELSTVAWPPRDLDEQDVVVNATPLGLHAEDPLEGVGLRTGLVVVDIVPVAGETPLVRRARRAGCVTIDGLPMLLHQAAASFELWTGRPAPLAAMRAALPRAA